MLNCILKLPSGRTTTHVAHHDDVIKWKHFPRHIDIASQTIGKSAGCSKVCSSWQPIKHRNSLLLSLQWPRKWLGAVRHHAITWANNDQDLCRHMTSLGHIVFNSRHYAWLTWRATDVTFQKDTFVTNSNISFLPTLKSHEYQLPFQGVH